MKCGICDATVGTLHQVRENMFGFNDVFNYFECKGCGALQLSDPPEDMSRYYPRDKYYSLQSVHTSPTTNGKPDITSWLSSKRNEAQLFDKSGLGSVLARLRPWPLLNELRSLVSDIPAGSLSSSILDVGCGRGYLLDQLATAGLTRLTGVDPYLQEDEIKVNGVRLRKCTLSDISGETYDFIMFNHSLEHMEGQITTLLAARDVLAADGICRVEVPISGCAAWHEYGTDWVEIDAPRHFCLHTVKSMKLAAERAGLEMYKTQYVGTPLQFWGSELYRAGMSLHDTSTNKIREPSTVFSPDQMASFGQRTASTNATGTAGRAVFYLRHETQQRH